MNPWSTDCEADALTTTPSRRYLTTTSHARCVFSRLRCNGHSLMLSSYLSRIGRIENPSCSACGTRPRTPLVSFCTVQLRTLCVDRSLVIFSLSLRPLVQALGSYSASGASWSFAVNPSLRRGWVTTTTTTTAKLKLQMRYYVTKGVSKFRRF